MRNVPNKSCRENQNTFYFQWPFSENRAVHEIMSENMVEPEKTRIIWRVRVAYWVSKPTRAHTHRNVILIGFHGNNGYVNAPQYYVIRTLPVLYPISSVSPILRTRV